jgi:hypothetical protein
MSNDNEKKNLKIDMDGNILNWSGVRRWN